MIVAEPKLLPTTAGFLTSVWGDPPDGPVNLYVRHGDRGQTAVIWCTSATDAATYLPRLTGADVWFGVATRTADLGPHHRGGIEDCRSIGALWADIDIAGPGHAASAKLCPDELAARMVLSAFPTPPSAVVRTGGGLQAWWYLDAPLAAAEATVILTRWGATWAKLAARFDVALDNVWNIDRVMRVPGTFNHKLDTPRPVTLVDHAGWTISVGDLDDILEPVPEAPVGMPSGPAVPWIGPRRPGDHFNAQHTVADVLTSAGWELHSVEKASGNRYWTRPGKSVREGKSATEYAVDGHVVIWTSAVPGLRERGSYDAFGLYAGIRHGGDIAAAASELARQGFGERHVAVNELARMLGGDVPEGQRQEPEEWPEPEPFEDYRPQAFPLDTLPAWMTNHAVAVSEQIQVPVDLCAMLALGCLSVAAMGHVRIALNDAWVEHLNLYLVVALESGTGKSPAEKMMGAPLKALEEELVAQAAEEVDQAEEHRKMLEGRLVKARQGAINADTPDMTKVFRVLEELEAAEVRSPPRLLAQDVTGEALAGLLQRHDGRIGIVSTESELFDIVAGAYATNGSKVNLNIFLKGWSADLLIIDRKGGSGTPPTSIRVKEPLLAIVVTVQPSVLATMAQRPDLVSRGFVPRFMVAAPTSWRGDRDRRTVLNEEALPTTKPYADAFLALGRRWAQWQHPGVVRCQPAAAEMFADWNQGRETSLRPQGRLAAIAEMVPKIEGSVLRTAGLLHLAHGSPHTEAVTELTMSRAIAIGNYWISHALHAYEQIAETGTQGLARAVLAHIIEHHMTSFSARDIYRHSALRRRLTPASKLDPVLALLTESGWIRMTSERRHGGGPRTTIWDTNPAAWTTTATVTVLDDIAIDQNDTDHKLSTLSTLPYKSVDITTTTTTTALSPPSPFRAGSVLSVDSQFLRDLGFEDPPPPPSPPPAAAEGSEEPSEAPGGLRSDPGPLPELF